MLSLGRLSPGWKLLAIFMRAGVAIDGCEGPDQEESHKALQAHKAGYES